MMAVLVLGTASCAPTPSPVAEVAQWRGIDSVRSTDGAVALVDRTGNGAVLCSWSLLVVALEVGKRCFAGQDEALQAELAISIKKTEAFIQKNSSSRPKPSDIAARKATMLRETRGLALCTADPAQLYRGFRDGGVHALRASTDELLSTPREPVMNPCI